MKKLLIAVLAALSLAGCVSTQSLSPQDRQRIQKMSMDPAIQKPAQASYLGPGGAIGLMFGPIGGALTYAANAPSGEALQQYAVQNNIFIERIVETELVTEIKRSGKLDISTAVDSDATLKITIRNFGFSIPHGFSSKLVPVLAVSCQLVNRQGTQIWQAYESVLPLGNPSDGVTVEELKQPEVIRQLWQLAAEAVAKKIVADL